jgi:ferredoxin--NADP+ reductase
VIGQGNVAMDVARILAMPVDDLQTTDMASHAVQTLRQSKVRQIHVVGRRGPAQAKFTPKEVSELGEIRDCDVVIDPGDLELSETDQAELALPDRKSNQRNMEILRQFAERPTGQASRRIVLRFMLSPVELRGEGGVRQAVFQKNQLVGEPGHQRAEGTGQTLTMDCQLFFRSVGYRGVRLPGVPFDDKRSVIPNDCGRVKGAQAMYCTGWIKRGASGLIGTNKADSQETVEQLLADAPQLTPASQRDNEALRRRLAERGVRAISFEDWKQIDAAEIERGRAQGKPRENFTTVDQMLAVLD